MLPLVVNLLFSLSPGIDMAAHLGGGVAGAGLILSGLIGWRRPEACRLAAGRLGRIARHGCLPDRRAGPRASVGATGGPRRWCPEAIPDTPVVVPVPRGLQPVPPGEGNGQCLRRPWLRPSRPVLLGWPTRGAGRGAEPAGRAVADGAREAARPLEKNESWDQVPRVVQLHLRPAVFSATRFREAGHIQTWLMVEGSWWVRLDVVVRPTRPRVGPTADRHRWRHHDHPQRARGRGRGRRARHRPAARQARSANRSYTSSSRLAAKSGHCRSLTCSQACIGTGRRDRSR